MKTLLVNKLVNEGLEIDNYLELDCLNIFLEELNQYESINDQIAYINDFLYGGCASGMIGELISYYQTSEFFKKHFDDMKEKINGYLEEGLIKPLEQFDSNYLVWLVFEDVIYNIISSIQYDEELQEELEINGLELNI